MEAANAQAAEGKVQQSGWTAAESFDKSRGPDAYRCQNHSWNEEGFDRNRACASSIYIKSSSLDMSWSFEVVDGIKLKWLCCWMSMITTIKLTASWFRAWFEPFTRQENCVRKRWLWARWTWRISEKVSRSIAENPGRDWLSSFHQFGFGPASLVHNLGRPQRIGDGSQLIGEPRFSKTLEEEQARATWAYCCNMLPPNSHSTL